MIALGAGVVGGLVAATQTEGGREWIRAQVVALANRGLHGKLTIGRISGSFLTDLRVDSIELRDPDDSVFIATGPVSLRYDPRDLVDGRFVFRAVEARSPLLVIRKELDGHWNFRKVFPVTDTTTRPVVRLPHGAFGALVLLHDIRVRGGEVWVEREGPLEILEGLVQAVVTRRVPVVAAFEVRLVRLGVRRLRAGSWAVGLE